MLVREFNGGDYIDFEMTAQLEIGLVWTVAVVFERRAAGAFTSFISFVGADDETKMVCGINSSDHPYVLTKTKSGFFITQPAASITVPEDAPCLLVFRCPGAFPTGINLWDGTSWVDAATPDVNGDLDEVAGGYIRVGRINTADTDDHTGGIAALAILRGVVPSDDEIHGLAGGDNISWCEEIAWTEIWEFNQDAWADPVPGLLGVSDSTAVVGDGTITCPDPPAEVYVVGVPWLQAPQISALPAVSGTAQPEQTVTCSAGSWRGAPTSYAYQWLLDGEVIAGETTSSYLLVNSDVGHLLACRVTATNEFGPTGTASAGRRVAPKPLPVAPSTVLVASLRAAGGWAERTIRYVSGDEWT